MDRDATIRFRHVRAAFMLAFALAMLIAPSALAQTPATAERGGDVAKLPVCGRPAGTASLSHEPAQATLTLDQEDQETVTTAAFGRSTDSQPLTLVYRVAGCRVTNGLSRPADPLPTGPVSTAGARMLPRGAVRIDDIDADGDRYVVHLRILASSGGASHDFTVGPGSYTTFVRLKAGWLRTVATPVTVTRSESRLWVPIGVGIGGSACGFLLFWLARKIHRDDLLVRETWVVALAGVASVFIGAGSAFFTNYINQDVWTFSANGLALFVAAFSASTAGVAAGLLTGIYKSSGPAEAGH